MAASITNLFNFHNKMFQINHKNPQNLKFEDFFSLNKMAEILLLYVYVKSP